MIASSGQPLDTRIRRSMELRLDHDFSQIRIHTDGRAAQSAEEIGAIAYTSGTNIAFARGKYQPGTVSGQRLIAHELVHVVQQSGPDNLSRKAFIQRACLPDPECEPPDTGEARVGSAKRFGEEVTEKAAPKRAERKKLPPETARSGLHGRPAEAVEHLFQEHISDLRPVIHGVFVDEDLPDDVGASRADCLQWAQVSLPPGTKVPEFEGAVHSCIFVPAALERQAAIYNSGGVPDPRFTRQEWLRWAVLRVLTHETTHARFLGANIRYPSSDENCTEERLAKEISELAAVISEFPFVNRLKQDLQDAWFNHHLKDPTEVTGESISGAIRDIRCSCECPDADAMIRAAFEFASSSWTERQKQTFHAHMKRGKGKEFDIYWPYDASRTGRVGRHELSLAAGVGFSGSDKLKVAMLTYRYVMWNWVEGRLRVTGGVQLNLASLFESDPHGEFGAAIGGLQFVSTPVSRDKRFGGFTGRLETGFGLGEFTLEPVAPQSRETTVSSRDWVLQVSGGVQFFIPRFTHLRPVSIEAAYRLAQPLDSDARQINTFSISAILPL
ncbi:eCIS core domain-containing protein [Halomicronema hongdechloris]|uniref:eCIS core domain-containing protein n=1 Tax=Halomicronema hongdechloris TaxID=1209493 RepID=UPI00165121AA|nr:DUF4157 domain-containing protein [Halomicronema hongdechloris]